jgi:hypothetical protein
MREGVALMLFLVGFGVLWVWYQTNKPEPAKPHEHQWVEVDRTIVPGGGSRSVTIPELPSQQKLLMELVYGFTTVELRCEGCGDIKTEHWVGGKTVARRS